jgi:hypothetical protein
MIPATLMVAGIITMFGAVGCGMYWAVCGVVGML